MNPAVVSLKGYADVNRELLSSVSGTFSANFNGKTIDNTCDISFKSLFRLQSVTTIAIYLIVLLQFKLSLISQQQISKANANSFTTMASNSN